MQELFHRKRGDTSCFGPKPISIQNPQHTTGQIKPAQSDNNKAPKKSLLLFGSCE